MDFAIQLQKQKILKVTECKVLGHLYLGVTHATMSSAVQTLRCR
jgi:hypothetical protein